MTIKQFANDPAVAQLAIGDATHLGQGNPTITTMGFPELDENGERTGNLIRTATISFMNEEGELCSDTVALEDLEMAVKHAVEATGEDFGYVSNGTHVPGPKPGPPAPGDTPPELEEDPLPPLAAQ